VYRDRRHARFELAWELLRPRLPRAVALNLPRAGLPVGHEVARAFAAPLALGKVHLPRQRELSASQRVFIGLWAPARAARAQDCMEGT